VGVEHHRLPGDAVRRGMDEHGGRLDAVAALQHFAMFVDEHDVVGAYLAPVQAARVDEEAARIVRQRHAEVVAHAFAQAVMRGRAQRQCQVFA
jgi:hypothetical protein